MPSVVHWLRDCIRLLPRTGRGRQRALRGAEPIGIIGVDPTRFRPLMRLPVSLLLPIGALLAVPRQANDAPLRGFSAEASRAQRQWEAKFRGIPEPARLREAMRRLAARPHHTGSPYDKDNAEWLRAQFASYGWDAQIEQFDVLFPTPRERVLEMVAPTRFVAKLEEPAVAGDPTSNQKAEQLPTYNAYSIDGDVTGPLVYVNYGIPADYEELERRGISVRGAIVIARYGGSWRGIKPKVAAEHGAIGCLIFSDPRDDGYAAEDVFPAGPMRPRDGVQRGSVMDMPVHPGDPLTPGVGATKDARRLARADAKTITKIPVLPISYGDAQPLLSALGGAVVPDGWKGGLPITYRFGPGPARVHLKLSFNWAITPLYDVVARLRGAELPDEWIVRGNHHDAWVNGAEDPTSGMVAELEEARALGELVKQGWRPKRTIIYAAWDGEEQGLLGSTEWAEAHADELKQKAVAYLNTDSNGRGFLGIAGSHTLERFINDVARDIEDPETKTSVWKRSRAVATRFGPASDRGRADLRIDALGSGSDYTPFIQHLGVASLNLGYGGEDPGGIYHSIYDDFFWYTRFSDTSFVYGRALAQTVGTAVMRLANAELLPFEFGNLAETVRGYVDQVVRLRDDMASRIAEQNRQIEEGVFAAINDPRRPVLPPKIEEVPPHLDFSPLQNASDRLTRAATAFERAYAKALGSAAATDGRAGRAPDFREVNRMLIESERRLTSTEGLPNRPWFRHLLYAPGFYTGYGVKTLPGAREAIEQKQWTDAAREIQRIARVLDAESELLTRATQALGK
jgi:N-acetylated-alpha-linked acidic dipeptidase